MNDSESFQRACATALRFLAYRPRSEGEVRTRLLGRFPDDTVEQVMQTLADRALVDDSRFARLWADDRDSFSPRSRSAIARELLSKGIDSDLAEVATRELDDHDSAYRAGLKHSRRLQRDDFATFRRRLWGFLRRRGFDYSVSKQVIGRLWNERQRCDGAVPEAVGDR
jgi:regulatory protein